MPRPWLRTDAATDPLWTVEELAVARSGGQQTFNVMRDHAFSSLSTPLHDEVGLFDEQNVAARKISVQTEGLTTIFHRLKAELGFSRPFLKLDTQGFDVEIVRSGDQILGEFVGLQSELAVKRIYEDSVDFRRAIDYYQGLGFELSALVPNNGGQFPVLVEIDCIMVRADLLDVS